MCIRLICVLERMDSKTEFVGIQYQAGSLG